MIIERNQYIFNSLGLRYLERPEIPLMLRDRLENEKFLETSYYLQNREEFNRLASAYGDQVKSSFLSPVEIREIPQLQGYGLFAASYIKSFSLIGEYTGIIQPAQDITAHLNEDRKYNTDYSWDYPMELSDSTELEINAYNAGNELRFVNHSFDPNCAADHFILDNRFVIVFYALADILQGQQILVDYGEEYWSGGVRQMVFI